MAKISRTQQIGDELTRLGLEPTQEAIDAVQAILRSDNRKTYKTACKAYYQQLNPQTEAPKRDRQTTPATESTQATQQGLNSTTRKVADVVKQTILSNGISIALQEIEQGDWGELNDKAKESLEQFNNFLEADFEVLDETFFAPSLPPSAQNLLPSTEEIFDNAVIGNTTP